MVAYVAVLVVRKLVISYPFLLIKLIMRTLFAFTNTQKWSWNLATQCGAIMSDQKLFRKMTRVFLSIAQHVKRQKGSSFIYRF
jgi:hypothetical protein